MVFVIITLLVSPARSQTCPQGCKFTDMFTLLVGEGGQVIGLASKAADLPILTDEKGKHAGEFAT